MVFTHLLRLRCDEADFFFIHFQFAPNLTPQEEFVYHWKCVTHYFVDNKG